ncbi:alpha/beta hydrolase [Angustibacter aerolatus]
MNLRTRAVLRLIEGFDRTEVVDATPAQRAASRRRRAPEVFPFDRVFGRVPRGTLRRDELAPTPSGPVRVRFVEQADRRTPGPMIVFVHGGGWVQGGVRRYDALCAQLAARTGALVASIDYRMAPEHPFPAAVDDCVSVTSWLVDEAGQLGVDPARIAVAGDSAGGNLAAVLAQHARDHGGPAFVLQALLYPATDATLSSPSIARNAHAPVLTRRDVEGFLHLYLGDGDPTDPRVSPLLAPSLAGLPPALVQTAELDPLADDGSRYAERLRAEGVPVRLTEYVDTPHGFHSFPGGVPVGAQALAELVTALREAFA